MSIIVRIPTPLQKLTQNQAEVKASGANKYLRIHVITWIKRLAYTDKPCQKI